MTTNGNGQQQRDVEPGEINEASLGVLESLLEKEVTRADVNVVAALSRSDIEAQLDAAHKYPRSVGRFLKEAKALATLTREVAESCIYTLPRAGKAITGPSVRLAEIAASSYCNLHITTRVIDPEKHDRTITAVGMTWDLEKNVKASDESKRRITDKNGNRYNDDMTTMTGNAAASIAYRNTVFRVIPRAYINEIYQAARLVAVGDAKTLGSRRESVVANFGKLGVVKEHVLAKVGRVTVEDITLDDLEVLIGIGTAIRQGSSIEEHFPSAASGVTPGAPVDTKGLEEKLRAQGTKGKPPAPPTAPTPAKPVPANDSTAPRAKPTPASDDSLFGKAAPAKGDEPADAEPPADVKLGDQP